MTISRVPDGILVSLHTTVSGGVHYQRRDLDAGDAANGSAAAAVSRWETTKLVDDVDELARATQVRGSATHTIRRVCVATSFGLVAPASRADELEQAIAEARRLVDEHNASARHSRVGLHVLCGRVSGTDPEAVRAIASELGRVLADLTSASEALDVARMREAASGALRLTALLPSDLAAEVERVVETARKAAREIKRDGSTTIPILPAVRRIRIDEEAA